MSDLVPALDCLEAELDAASDGLEHVCLKPILGCMSFAACSKRAVSMHASIDPDLFDC